MKKETKNHFTYHEIGIEIFDMFDKSIDTFWCWDYDFGRAMSGFWAHLKNMGKFPHHYKRLKGYWKADSEMRKYQPPYPLLK